MAGQSRQAAKGHIHTIVLHQAFHHVRNIHILSVEALYNGHA